MRVATFSGNPSTTVITCYSPINVCNESDLISFYNGLFFLVWNIFENNVLIIGGNINVQIDKDENNKLCSHNLSNINGEHLAELSVENGRTFLNIKYLKSKGKY